MTRLEEMVITFFPTARPETDFTFISNPDGTAQLDKWDTLRLGEKPDLKHLRKHFLDYINKKSKTIPTIDTTDPAPWLSDDRIEEFETSKERMTPEPESSKKERYILTNNGTLLRFR